MRAVRIGTGQDGDTISQCRVFANLNLFLGQQEAATIYLCMDMQFNIVITAYDADIRRDFTPPLIPLLPIVYTTSYNNDVAEEVSIMFYIEISYSCYLCKEYSSKD